MNYALITGASQGIGLRFARSLAADYGYHLIMVSNQAEQLATEAEAIRCQTGVTVLTLCVDLARSEAADEVYAFCRERGIEPEVLVNNAGILIFDAFVRTDAKKIETLLMLNVLTLTRLTRLMLPAMEAKRKGYVLCMSSMTAYTDLPGIQCYNACKAYILHFCRSLWYETRDQGVHVMALVPGSTATTLLPFPPVMDKWLKRTGITMPPERLVRKGLRALFRSRRKSYMPGAWNTIITFVLRHLPDWFVLRATRKLLFNDKKN